MKMSNSSYQLQRLQAVLCAALLLAPQSTFALQQPQTQPATGPSQPNLSPDQLDSLVAPIALYPDQLLSQVLVASTYPLEVVEAGRWLSANPNLKGPDLANAAAQQPWDASVQALVLIPDALNKLDQNINWTTDLGNAFLAQESGVMDAVQRMRKRAMDSGKLQSTPQQTVSTQGEGDATYVEIQPANPQVVYVPQYSPVAVWGPPAYYPYPAIAYPTGDVLTAGILGFGTGIAIGSYWGGGWGGWGGWGWHPNWGGRNVYVNNTFFNRSHFRPGVAGAGNIWQHNAMHRGGVPYGNRDIANRFGRGGFGPMNRPTPGQVQQGLGQAGRSMGMGNFQGVRPGQGPGQGMMPGRPGQGMPGRPGGNLPGVNPMGGASRGPATPGGGPAMTPGQGGANRVTPNMGDRMGNRQVGGGATGGGAFRDMGQGRGGAGMNMNRGMGSFGGGAFRGGGGGFRGGGGGFRGGGGGFRGGGRRR